MLSIEDVVVSYDGYINALKGINIRIEEGEFVSLLGGNGSGKSTTLRTICGWLKPVSGKITFAGRRIDGLPAEQVLRRGIAMVPESRRLFPYMTVKENLLIGAYTRKDSKIREDMERLLELFSGLKERLNQPAITLSGGEQQMLATSRALMSQPKLLLMDEPSMGLAPILVKGVLEAAKQINMQGTAILMVEQNANAALQITQRAYVLENGRIAISGISRVLLSDEKMKAVYLGNLSKRGLGDAKPTID
jgi:branched-chain amino acid transport system ATP-binding protein